MRTCKECGTLKPREEVSYHNVCHDCQGFTCLKCEKDKYRQAFHTNGEGKPHARCKTCEVKQPTQECERCKEIKTIVSFQNMKNLNNRSGIRRNENDYCVDCKDSMRCTVKDCSKWYSPAAEGWTANTTTPICRACRANRFPPCQSCGCASSVAVLDEDRIDGNWYRSSFTCDRGIDTDTDTDTDRDPDPDTDTDADPGTNEDSNRLI